MAIVSSRSSRSISVSVIITAGRRMDGNATPFANVPPVPIPVAKGAPAGSTAPG
jgi:hypothetical protein